MIGILGYLSNYLGCLRNVLVAENYEASTGYFPVLWRSNAPHVTIGNLEPQRAPSNWNVGKGPRINSDYVLLIGKPTDAVRIDQKVLFEQLDQSYYLQKETNLFSLYRFK